MKHKLFMLGFLCLGLTSMVIANDGDKKKKTSSTKSSTTLKKAKTVAKTPVKTVKKVTPVK
ncbi:MAG: hypothetical protein EOO02_11645, partial [Chitinophagaceae bacterium]